MEMDHWWKRCLSLGQGSKFPLVSFMGCSDLLDLQKMAEGGGEVLSLSGLT